MAPSAVVNSNSGPVVLHHQVHTVITEVKITEGQWLLLAKVVFFNDDGDFQDAAAQLLASPGNEPIQIDLSIASVPPAGGEGHAARFSSVSLLAWWQVDREETIQLVCWAYKGGAIRSSLVAVRANLLDPTTDQPTNNFPLPPGLPQ